MYLLIVVMPVFSPVFDEQYALCNFCKFCCGCFEHYYERRKSLKVGVVGQNAHEKDERSFKRYKVDVVDQNQSREN